MNYGILFVILMKYSSLLKKLDTDFLTLPVEILYKSAIFDWYSGSIYRLISILPNG